MHVFGDEVDDRIELVGTAVGAVGEWSSNGVRLVNLGTTHDRGAYDHPNVREKCVSRDG